jgi:hypothetical protein
MDAGFEAGFNVMAAAEVLVVSLLLVAVKVTVLLVLIVEGAE